MKDKTHRNVLSIVSLFLFLVSINQSYATLGSLFQIKKAHEFSNPGKQDTFKLEVQGTNILTSKIQFKITNSLGNEIYSIEFLSVDLINEGLPKGINASKKEKEQFILKRLREFFDDKNFISPAIKEDEDFDSDYINKNIWSEIKNDKTAIGFYYLLGEEDNKKIVFLKKSKKVVVYYNCC